MSMLLSRASPDSHCLLDGAAFATCQGLSDAIGIESCVVDIASVELVQLRSEWPRQPSS